MGVSVGEDEDAGFNGRVGSRGRGHGWFGGREGRSLGGRERGPVGRGSAELGYVVRVTWTRLLV